MPGEPVGDLLGQREEQEGTGGPDQQVERPEAGAAEPALYEIAAGPEGGDPEQPLARPEVEDPEPLDIEQDHAEQQCRDGEGETADHGASSTVAGSMRRTGRSPAISISPSSRT